jgi:hypothetical protein
LYHLFLSALLLIFLKKEYPLMDAASLAIGSYQPIPFPAPVWLLQSLLVAGFYIHAIPMNVTLMGGLMAAVLLLFGRSSNNEHAQRAGATLAYSLPFFTTLTITNGIVPLLFLQVLYGPVIYVSSILMALPWMAVLLLLAVGYYGFYIYSYKREWAGARSPWILIGSSLLFLVIAFMFTNNMTLMLHPEKFLPMYQASASGNHLNLDEPTLVPRLLHFIVGATAVSSLVLGCFGLYQQKRDADYSHWLIRVSSGLFLGMTFLQFIIGPWFLNALPPAVMGKFLNLSDPSHAAHPFYLSMGLDLVSIIAMSLAWARNSAKAFKVGLVSALGLVLSMVVTRHMLRLVMLDGIVNPQTQPVETQTLLLWIFGILTAVTIGYFVWLFKITWKAFHPDGSSSAQ